MWERHLKWREERNIDEAHHVSVTGVTVQVLRIYRPCRKSMSNREGKVGTDELLVHLNLAVRTPEDLASGLNYCDKRQSTLLLLP